MNISEIGQFILLYADNKQKVKHEQSFSLIGHLIGTTKGHVMDKIPKFPSQLHAYKIFFLQFHSRSPQAK